MPRATKDSQKDELKEKKTTTKKSATTTKKKPTTKSTNVEKEATPKVTKSNAKKEAESTVEKKETSKRTSKTSSTTKKTTSTKKSTTDTKKKPSSTKKTTSTKTTTKKTSVTKKKSTAAITTKKKSTTKTKKLDNNIVAEYYDLPYRYNETIVKILYQTPTILFVYWDISDFDRENFIAQYGQNFFYNTKPILKIFNLTKGYDFEVEINDFANSWYINVNDAYCEYKVELARRTIKYEENLNTDYIYVSSSNNIEFPNDRILLDELPDKINFKNVKTNAITTKDIKTLRLVGIDKIYKVHDFYKKFYKDEILEELNSKRIIIPSSSSWN